MDEGFLRACDREEREARGIKPQHGIAEPGDDGVSEEGQEAGQHGDAEIGPVRDGRRRNGSNQKVTGDASRIAGRERQHHHAENIEPMLDRCRGTADRKYERAHQIQHHQQNMCHGPSRSNSYVLCDNQTRAATTNASTPVSRVG